MFLHFQGSMEIRKDTTEKEEHHIWSVQVMNELLRENSFVRVRELSEISGGSRPQATVWRFSDTDAIKHMFKNSMPQNFFRRLQTVEARPRRTYSTKSHHQELVKSGGAWLTNTSPNPLRGGSPHCHCRLRTQPTLREGQNDIPVLRKPDWHSNFSAVWSDLLPSDLFLLNSTVSLVLNLTKGYIGNGATA
ncbi:hypothetical protein D5086_004445 [Populus alba]|uniref:Uncharacterized protein n=1 Tax=Populus alba TaxID=43335 RepID=A0ACC4CQE8_POPAL